MNDKTKMISLRLPLSLDREIRIEAARCDLNRSDFIRQTMAAKLAEFKRQRQAGGGREVAHDG